MNTFVAIEKVLSFHHTTSRGPLRIATLCRRTQQNGTRVTLKDIEQVQQVWHEAYHVYYVGAMQVIEALDLPYNRDARLKTFVSRFDNKENSMVSPAPVLRKIQTLSARVTKRPVLMGRLATQQNRICAVNRTGTLLERVRAREAQLKQTNPQVTKDSAQDAFLMSQIPKVKGVLNELLLKNKTSLALEQMMQILRINMFKLSDDEILRSLHLLEQTSNVCKVVTVGNETHVRLVST